MADRALKRASEEVLCGGKLMEASGSLEEGLIEAKCQGTAPANRYTVSVRFDPPEPNGQVTWGEPTCSCPQAGLAAVCKHALALLLARLDPAKWKAAQKSMQPAAAGGAGAAGGGDGGGAAPQAGKRKLPSILAAPAPK